MKIFVMHLKQPIVVGNQFIISYSRKINW